MGNLSPAPGTSIETYRIDLVAELRRNDRAALECWRRRFAETVLPVDVEPLSDGRTVAQVGVLCDGPVLVAHYELSPLSMRRGSDLVSSKGDCATISYVLDGTFTASQIGAPGTITAGGGVAMITDRTSVLETPTGGSFVGIRLPKALLEARGVDPERLTGLFLSRHAPGLRLFRAYVDQLRRDAGVPASMRPMVANHLADLVASSLVAALGVRDDTGHRPGVREGRRARIRQIMESSFADSDLDPSTVARQVGISVRSLQVLFHEEGTSFSDSLRDLRLAHAYSLLTSPYVASGIADVAFSVGFRDVTTFNRAFRRRYDASPSAVRHAAW